jgi:hypothetical protein
MSLVRRFYEPLDITVVELTATAQNVNGHMVQAAANLNEVSDTLGVNEGDAKNNDGYVLVGLISIGASGDNPVFFASNGYGGIATGTDIGSANNNDGSALVLLRPVPGPGGAPLYSAQFLGDQVAHEAAHTFGLRHTCGT